MATAYPTELDAARLARACRPRTVIDVGVGFGTLPLYEAFPAAKFFLVEPLREYDAAIADIARRFDCTVHHVGLGRAPGMRDLHVDLKDPQRSSVQPRTPLTESGNPIEARRITVTTLDVLFAEGQHLEAPVLLKIDVEGQELDVLEGATRVLQTTEAVIAEVSVGRRFLDGYRFEDLVVFMRDHGFRVHDFLTMIYGPDELTPRYTDVLFVRE